MTEEPRWPTVRDVEGEASTPERFKAVTRAIELCRAAWLASVDDPRKSLAGEHRADETGREYVKMYRQHLDDYRWLAITGGWADRDNDSVKGWKVVYTPAAEAKP